MKKIISIILALSIIMSSFGVFAKVYFPIYEHMDDVFRFDVGDFVASELEGGAAATPAMKRMQLLETIGIWDDASKSENDLVTMTEFSIIMSRLKLGKNNALEEVYKQNPNNENATYRNAFAYLIEVLGYAHECARYNNTDEAMLIVASELGLIPENSPDINAYITRGELSALIAKALTIDMCVMEYTSSGDYRYVVTDGKTLLSSVHGIFEITGFVNAIPGLTVYGSSSLKDDCIQIDRRDYKVSGLEVREFFGALVTAYAIYDEELNEYTIVSMGYADNYTATEINFKDIIDFRNGTLYYLDSENIEVDVNIASLSYITENGDILNSIYDLGENLNQYFQNNEGKIILTASEENGETDTAIIYNYGYYVSSYIDASQYRIGLSFRQVYKGNEFVQLDEKAVINVFVDGVSTTFTQIPAGTPFRIFQSDDTGYTEIVAKTGKMTGSVDVIDEDYVEIAENRYRLTKTLLNHIDYCENTPSIPASQKVKNPEIGLAATFYVLDDLVVYYSVSTEYKYGYLKNLSQARTGIDPDLTFRILTQDGEWDDFKVTKNITVDGKANVSKEEILAMVNNNLNIMNNVIRFKANVENELLELDTIEESVYETETTDDVKFVANFNGSMHWTYEFLNASSLYFLSANTVIFVVPAGETDESKFRVVKNTALPYGSGDAYYVPMKFYSPNDFNQISVAVCTKSLDDIGSGSGSNEFYYVESIRNTVINPDDQEYGYKIIAKKFVRVDSGDSSKRIGYLADASFTIPEDALDTNVVTEDDRAYDINKKLQVGDLIRANVTSGHAARWQMILKGGVVGNLSTPDDDINDYNQLGGEEVYVKAKVCLIDPVSRLILLESEGNKRPFYLNVTAIIDPVTKEIRNATPGDFNEGDTVYAFSGAGRMYFMVKNSQIQ